MKTRTVQVTDGEWLGPVPADYDFQAFYDEYLKGSGHRQESYDRAVATYKATAEALERGARVWVECGQFTHQVYRCEMYDGWVFWVPRPCLAYVGPIPGEHIDELYDMTRIARIEEAERVGQSIGEKT